MPAEFDWSQIADLNNAETFAVREADYQSGSRRLQGSFYGSAGYRSVKALAESGFPLLQIRDCAIVQWFGPFGRIYVHDREAGIPFLGSSEMMDARLTPKNFLSKTLMANVDRIRVREGTILISCSGTIGNVALCTKDYDGMTVSQHAIRVIARQDSDLGVLYVFLLSAGGQFLVKQNRSGSVIQSIYAEDVLSLPIPRLPYALRVRLTALVQSASAARVRANLLLDEAQELVYRQNYLAPTKSAAAAEGPTIFQISSDQVRESWRNGEHLRLDATYYEPIALSVRKSIQRCRRWESLKDVVESVVLIGKTFVDGVFKVGKEYGVPYYTGKELMRNRPLPETFITCQKRSILDRLTVKRGTTLVTCAGTVGRVMYVRGNFEGTSVTHDAMRISPSSAAHAGYIYAFLSSPAGQAQLARCSYGSVIPRLYRTHVEQVLVPLPPDNGASIGSKIDEAFDLRASALQSEDAALALFGEALERGRAYVEREWGAEY